MYKISSKSNGISFILQLLHIEPSLFGLYGAHNYLNLKLRTIFHTLLSTMIKIQLSHGGRFSK